MAKTPTTKTPRVSILERRLQNPFGEPSQQIRFKEQGIVARWINDDVKPGQVHRGKELGWQPVTAEMIADIDTLGFHTINPAQQITRGERGREVLMWMPESDYQQIQWAKTKKNLDDMRDFDKEKHAMLNAAAAKFGSEAADYLNDRVGPAGSVRTTREIVQRMPEGE